MILPIIVRLVQSHFRHRLAEVENLIRLTAYRQHLAISPGDGDHQAHLHRDTFFPALKFFYFPEDVTEGAIIYVDNSPKLTQERLEWEAAQVEIVRNHIVEPWREPGHRAGSFRVSDAELTGMGLTATPVNVPGDTLVVVNVFGFHARGAVEAPVDRLSLSDIERPPESDRA